MEAISRVLDHTEVQVTISNSNRAELSVKCWRCLDVGVRLRDVKTGRLVVISADPETPRPTGEVTSENCLCVRRRLAKAQLAIIPPKFGSPRLRSLEPRADLHPSQASAIEFVKANPATSVLLTGRNGTGKTHIGWALYREALAVRRPVIACTVRDLLMEYRRVEVGVPEGETLKTPRVTAENLKKPGSKPWLLFIDEFEKVRPSEFNSEQLFALLDAATSFGHQLVITSNMNPGALGAHWGRIDEVWGNSIMTRLQTCFQVDFS